MTRSVNHQMLTELQITQYTVYIAEHSLILTKNTKIQLISYVPQSNWWVHKGLHAALFIRNVVKMCLVSILHFCSFFVQSFLIFKEVMWIVVSY